MHPLFAPCFPPAYPILKWFFKSKWLNICSSSYSYRILIRTASRLLFLPKIRFDRLNKIFSFELNFFSWIKQDASAMRRGWQNNRVGLHHRRHCGLHRFQVDHHGLLKKRKHLPNLFQLFSMPFLRWKTVRRNDGARGVSWYPTDKRVMCANIIVGVRLPQMQCVTKKKIIPMTHPKTAFVSFWRVNRIGRV